VTSSPNQLLMGGGIPAAKFDAPGATITGTISNLEAAPQTDFQTGEPLTWKDGSPRMQVVATLEGTNHRDPSNPEDDGARKVYIKGRNLTNAIRDAVRKAGATGLDTGGTLQVTYTGDGAAERGLNPPKTYAATYTAPASAANTALGLAQQPQAPAAPAPAPQQPAAAAASPVDTAKQLLAAGVDHAAVIAATGLSAEVVAALANLG